MAVSSLPGLAKVLPGSIVQSLPAGRVGIILAAACEIIGGLELMGFSFLVGDHRVLDRSNDLLSPNTIAGRYKVLFSVQKESG